MEYFHSVKLDEDKCKGCTNCIKKCPTEAIRVRNRKAYIINERCIDCGECIRVCPYHAKKPITDDLEMIKGFRYKVVIPAPSLYEQFGESFSRGRILKGLLKLGFDEVFEVSRAAEIITDATKKILKEKKLKKPVISSACPAVVRLIQVRFPNLIDNILKIESPMEAAARIVKKQITKKKGLKIKDIGVFFISPCAAKVTSVKAPMEYKHSYVDGVIAMKDIHLKLLQNIKKIGNNEGGELIQSGFKGVSWAKSGGESLALGEKQYVAVHGINNVIKILEEIVEDRLDGIEFIEALACPEGCLGGPLTVENPFVAKTNIQKQVEQAKNMNFEEFNVADDYEKLLWTEPIEYKSILKLDEDMFKAMEKMEKLEEICERLPGLDCGACGAPNCRALAEDIVRGEASETDCIFKLKEKLGTLAKQLKQLE